MKLFGKCLVTAAVASTAIVAVPGVASAQCASDKFTKYTMSSNRGLVLQGLGSPAIHRNYGGGTVSYTVTQSGSGTSAWSVNAEVGGTAGFDFYAVKAEVSLKVGGSYTNSKTTSGSVAIGLSIPANYYGIAQFGVQRRYTAGTYEHDDGYCHYTSRSIYTKLPYTVNGSASVVNSTGVVPWDQS